MQKYVKLIAVILLALNCTGCLLLAGAAGGAGTAVWLQGKLERTFSKSMSRVSDAAQDALKALDYDITSLVVKNEVTQIRAEHADGRKIWIDVLELGSSESKIEIRVGVQGDEAESEKILDQIKRRI